MTLIDLMIDQYERSSKWNRDFTGNTSFRIEEKHYKSIGKNSLLQEAKKLEEDRLLKIRWVKGYYNEDIEKVEYPLAHIEYFYQLASRVPKYKLVEQKLNMVSVYYDQIKSSWIRLYTEEEIFIRLNKGTDNHEFEVLQELYQCLKALDQLESPIFKRVFSKKYLKNSKKFEKELQDKIIRIARKYHEDIEDMMEDTQVLSQLFIEEYAQELAVKGSIILEVSGSRVDTGVFPYGTVLNTQTLKNAVILNNQQITKVLSIENKANFLVEPFEEGTLIIFSHGYFTPVEREFLIKLRDKLSGQKVTYLHSGDLDYGGIRIFQHIRKRIFPKVQPYRMDAETFDRYISYGEPIEQGTLDKINRLDEPLLKPVIERIIDLNQVIEQEAFL